MNLCQRRNALHYWKLVPSRHFLGGGEAGEATTAADSLLQKYSGVVARNIHPAPRRVARSEHIHDQMGEGPKTPEDAAHLYDLGR